MYECLKVNRNFQAEHDNESMSEEKISAENMLSVLWNFMITIFKQISVKVVISVCEIRIICSNKFKSKVEWFRNSSFSSIYL